MDDQPLLSVVLPCFNPSRGWMQTVEKRLLAIQSRVASMELIIVNDGSDKHFDLNQATGYFARFKEVKIISHTKNMGKGHAVRTGVKQCRGAIIIYTDIDFPYTMESFFRVLQALETGSIDVCIGVRPDKYYTHLPLARVRISKFLKLLIRRLLRLPADDTQCGLKGFNQAGKEVFLQTTINRYLFDLEFIFLAARKNLRIKTEAVDLRADVKLPAVPWQVLVQETGNFIKIFTQSIF
jgi:glycosyltransferase involved in cell wall biosynthesis